MPHRPWYAAVALLAATSVASCGDASEDPNGGHATEQAAVDVKQAVQAFRVFTDEVPVDSPIDYLPRAKLVVTGVVEDFTPGRIIGAEEISSPLAYPMVTMHVATTEVIKGEMPPGDMTYVELPLNGYDVEHFKEALPQGTIVALYLWPASLEGGGLIVGNESAGLPPGSQLWVPSGSEAIVVATGEPGVLLPGTGQVLPGKTIHGLLPES